MAIIGHWRDIYRGGVLFVEEPELSPWYADRRKQRIPCQAPCADCGRPFNSLYCQATFWLCPYCGALLVALGMTSRAPLPNELRSIPNLGAILRKQRAIKDFMR